jgi:hypothetical protein
VDPALPDLMGRRVLGSRAVLMAMNLVDLADQADPVGPTSPAGQASLVHPASLAAKDPTAPVGRVGTADLHRRLLRRTSSTASTTNLAPRWADPGTCRTGSARQITVRRRRRGTADSDGTMGLPREPRRRSGTDRRPQEGGAVRRLLVVGTVDGMGRLAISGTRSPITDRSPTTGTTRSRSSTRSSGDGDSGSSASGSRCTDLTRD